MNKGIYTYVYVCIDIFIYLFMDAFVPTCKPSHAASFSSPTFSYSSLWKMGGLYVVQ